MITFKVLANDGEFAMAGVGVTVFRTLRRERWDPAKSREEFLAAYPVGTAVYFPSVPPKEAE